MEELTQQPPQSDSGVRTIANCRIAIVPFPALGDTTIYLRLAQTLSQAGAKVTLVSDLWASAKDMLEWVSVIPLGKVSVSDLALAYDLLIVDVLAPAVRRFDEQHQLSSLSNVLTVTAKHFPSGFKRPKLSDDLRQIANDEMLRPFCPPRGRGKTMVEWVDIYAKDVFGLEAAPIPPPMHLPDDGADNGREGQLVLIFPTTPNPNKNYSPHGFRRLSESLKKQGWRTEVVCMPKEEDELRAFFSTDTVRSFPSIRELIVRIAESHAVISNDSGGGHLASMLGKPTVTITKKSKDFVWRPGFTDQGVTITPIVTIKWFSGRAWRPFIPHSPILRAIGSCIGSCKA